MRWKKLLLSSSFLPLFERLFSLAFTARAIPSPEVAGLVLRPNWLKYIQEMCQKLAHSAPIGYTCFKKVQSDYQMCHAPEALKEEKQ